MFWLTKDASRKQELSEIYIICSIPELEREYIHCTLAPNLTKFYWLVSDNAMYNYKNEDK